MFEAELGRTPTSAEGAAIRNAALLNALSEDAAARRLDGDSTISFEDIVRLTRAAQAATRALGLQSGGQKPEPPTIKEYIKTLGAAPAADAPSAALATHPRPSNRDGEAPEAM
jgi:hypothetical protein